MSKRDDLLDILADSECVAPADTLDKILDALLATLTAVDDAAIQRAADVICDSRWEDDVSCEDLARAAVAALGKPTSS